MSDSLPAAKSTSKASLAGYWICTALVAFSMLSGGISELMHVPNVMQGMSQLGYPAYFVTILGFWKVLGTVAIVLPGFRLVKEWAYAGIIFDLTGASASYVFTHGETWHILTPLIIAALAVGSWGLRPEGRRLQWR